MAYIDPDISGAAVEWDIAQCRRLARRLGYALLFLPEFSALGLVDLVREIDVDAVVVPSPAHVSPRLVGLLAGACDVESVHPRRSVCCRVRLA
ncbi:hypothetical protein ACFOS0_36330 [Nocardia seriolae]|uniref:Uncharacterized protein n=1 Tax=Nocardia seriolae TaxID=37332 RepID=A0ABC9YWY0_9NOCA|nr:hypothetical protein [Nocardia seriolae]MTJ72873.1 hypothetical protein [Nocardia seriolae]MTK49829.1 hypothetical protein [Nocardia seriolae]MTL14798.1 hypothetical protein [Nocardia seriolae]PSK29638.1 hypothetical protein C6575_19990 [Nocardia seriolae]RLP30504.1 hypothetical protein D6158_18230 [Nocardia seriolae]